MYQKFNDNNMITKFIKNLLATTYIPTIKIWKPGDVIVQNTSYISGEYIIRGKYSITDTSNIHPTDTNYFDIIEPYIRGKFYKGVSSNYISNSSIYDAQTHYYLGQYLRMLRDLDNIDLMSYYNCWDGTYSDKIRILKQDNIFKLTQNNNIKDGLKVLVIPIKFNTKYTIYLNNNMPTIITDIYYDGLNILDRNASNKKFQVIPRIAKNQPFLFNGVGSSDISSFNNLKEEYLHLIIQLPEADSSNIIVLEGDYTDWKVFKNNKITKTYYGDNNLDNLSTQEFNNYFKSGISLLNTATTQNYAFSDRLIEYLLLNVIDSKEQISSNIERVQKYLSTYKSQQLNNMRLSKDDYRKGIWNRTLRKFIYDTVTNFSTPLIFDINGFVDKDSEKIILRGKE